MKDYKKSEMKHEKKEGKKHEGMEKKKCTPSMARRQGKK